MKKEKRGKLGSFVPKGKINLDRFKGSSNVGSARIPSLDDVKAAERDIPVWGRRAGEAELESIYARSGLSRAR
jgi:hypothetical protein